MVGRPLNENRMLAEIAGEKTYRGSSHDCGTNERYTKGGACVHCARRIQREQREARQAELLAAAEQREIADLAADSDTDYFDSPTIGSDPWD